MCPFLSVCFHAVKGIQLDPTYLDTILKTFGNTTTNWRPPTTTTDLRRSQLLFQLEFWSKFDWFCRRILKEFIFSLWSEKQIASEFFKKFLDEFWLEKQPALPIFDPTKEEKIVEPASTNEMQVTIKVI